MSDSITDIAVTGLGGIVPRPGPSYAIFWMGVGSFSLFLKLPFETGCADISVRAEWAAETLSASIAFS
jgi:hypothetical protein